MEISRSVSEGPSRGGSDQVHRTSIVLKLRRSLSDGSTFPRVSEEEYLTEDLARSQARIAQRDLELLRASDGIDETVLAAAERRLRKAEKALLRVIKAREEETLDQLSETGGSSVFDDSSLLELYPEGTKRITLEVYPISNDIDLEALALAIEHVKSETGEPWLNHWRVSQAGFGHSKLTLSVHRTINCHEIDDICDRLTDEFPGDIGEIEVKFHKTLLSQSSKTSNSEEN